MLFSRRCLVYQELSGTGDNDNVSYEDSDAEFEPTQRIPTRPAKPHGRSVFFNDNDDIISGVAFTFSFNVSIRRRREDPPRLFDLNSSDEEEEPAALVCPTCGVGNCLGFCSSETSPEQCAGGQAEFESSVRGDQPSGGPSSQPHDDSAVGFPEASTVDPHGESSPSGQPISCSEDESSSEEQEHPKPSEHSQKNRGHWLYSPLKAPTAPRTPPLRPAEKRPKGVNLSNLKSSCFLFN